MALCEMRIAEDGSVYEYSKVEESIRYLKAFEPPEGYFLAFSGGKDSCVLKALADMAGVKYDAHYSVTSVDLPELIRFIREYHPDVQFDFPREDPDDPDSPVITMWNLIPEKVISDKVVELIKNDSTIKYEIWRRADAWQCTDSPAIKILNDSIEDNKHLIRDRVSVEVGKYPLDEVREAFFDMAVNILEEKLFGGKSDD